MERRAERVRHICRLVAQWRALPDGETRTLVEGAVREEAADSGEYAAVVRAYLEAELGWVIPGPTNGTAANQVESVQAETGFRRSGCLRAIPKPARVFENAWSPTLI